MVDENESTVGSSLTHGRGVFTVSSKVCRPLYDSMNLSLFSTKEILAGFNSLLENVYILRSENHHVSGKERTGSSSPMKRG